jgi:hypothetical protein
VFEQNTTIDREKGEKLILRRIVVKLKEATRHGDLEIAIITNFPCFHGTSPKREEEQMFTLTGVPLDTKEMMTQRGEQP